MTHLARLLSLLALATPALAADPPDAPYPLTITLGRILALCRTGTIACPAREAICDDPAIATPDDTPDGLGLRGVAPGTTLCSARGASWQRRVYRVTVVKR